MPSLKLLFIFTILSLPAPVFAELIKLECNIVHDNFRDDYSIVIDLDKKTVSSTYHAASSKDHSVTIDYMITSTADITKDTIVYKAKLNSFAYTFSINRTTLSITRHLDDVSDAEAGRGSCQSKEARGR